MSGQDFLIVRGRVYHEYAVSCAKVGQRLVELRGAGCIIQRDGTVFTGPGVRISYKKDQP